MLSIILVFGLLGAICLASGVLLYERDDKSSARVFIVALVSLVALSCGGYIYAGNVRDDMRTAAERQGIAIIIDPLTNDALAISPCVFGVDFAPAAGVLLFSGTSTPAVLIDAEQRCKDE